MCSLQISQNHYQSSLFFAKSLVMSKISSNFAHSHIYMIMCKMKDFINKTTTYLEVMFNQKISITKLSKKEITCLPLYITSNYVCYQLQLFAADVVLLCCTEELSFTPLQLKKQKELVEEKLGKIVVFAFDNMASYNIQRLTAQRVNFIIPPRIMFIPDRFIDFKLLKATYTPSETMPVMAQCIVLYHLQIQSLNGKTAQEIAEHFAVSYPNINRAIRWLAEQKIITLEGSKTKQIFFPKEQDLWKKIKSHIFNPIERVLFTDETLPEAHIAGVNALATYTMLNSEEQQTFAITKEQAKHLKITTDKKFGTNRIEVWKYDPAYLSTDKIVDKTSLFLTLQNNEDERVQIALETLLESLIWYTE